MDEFAGQEIELKLEIRPEDAARIGGLKSLPHARMGLPKAQQVVTVYFDTPDMALRRAGLSLRLRHAGSKRLQTVKTEPNGMGLGAPRAEDEVPVNGSGPDIGRIADLGLRERVSEIASKNTLKPQFETVVLRTTRHIKTTLGDVVELAVDLGEVRADATEYPISELELELKSGSPRALFDLARALNEAVPLRLLRLTKADRGYALMGAKIGAVQKAKPVKLEADADAGEALHIIFEGCLAHLLANEPAVVEVRGSDGLHQLRVALRRLRSALSICDGLIDPKLLDQLEHEIRGITAITGPARDYDVFLTNLLPQAAEFLVDRPDAVAALKRNVERARADAWAKAVEAVASARFTALVIELASLAAEPARPKAEGARRRDFAEPAQDFAARALERQLRKATKLGSTLNSLTDEERHKLRKRLKVLRYTAEFFASLYPEKETKPYLKRLGALQDSFGALNDVATAGRLIEALSAFGQGTKAGLAAEAGAEVLAWHETQAKAETGRASECWEKLSRRHPFWRQT